MKLPTLFFIVCALVGCVLVDCDASKLDESQFSLTYHSIGSHGDFVKKMKKHKVSLTSVIEDGNHKMSPPSSWKWSKHKAALGWESTKDFDDMGTKKWVPQGISSTADAYDKGDWNGKRAFVVSWHNQDDSKVRVTFVDMETNKYRHALLVLPKGDDDFTSFKKLHAGGIAWYGDTLWVVDTAVGVRVFDLANVFKVSIGDGVGKSGDKWTAAGYKYIIPQKGYYKTNKKFQFSFMALDRTESPDTMMFGEYQTATAVGDGAVTRLAKWTLDYKKRALASTKAVFAYCMGIARMQGAMSANKKYYISASNVNSPSNLYTWTPGQNPQKHNHYFPPHSEDLSYDKKGNVMYAVTEGEGQRYIITYEL